MRKEKKMAKVYIEYNPYTVETIFKINGEEVKSQEKYKSISKQKEKRLQYYLEADNKNWGGIVEEFRKIINSKDIDIEFKGRKIDYDDLEYTVLKYKVKLIKVLQIFRELLLLMVSRYMIHFKKFQKKYNVYLLLIAI